MQPRVGWCNLSGDMVRTIALRLDLSDAVRLSSSCRLYRAAIWKTDSFWAERLKRDYPRATGRSREIYRAAHVGVRSVDEDGTIRYLDGNGLLHRPDGPSLEYVDGKRVWHRRSLLHRIEGPAVEYQDGGKAWYRNGQLHRTDGPAMDYPAVRAWYDQDRLHRIEGPAVEYQDGGKAWYRRGVLHREDGPAVLLPDGTEQWYQNGQLIDRKKRGWWY